MMGFLVALAFAVVVSVGPTSAADLGFETTADGIVKRLLTPPPGAGAAPFRGRGALSTAKKFEPRGVSVVVRREDGGIERKTVTAADRRIGGSVNLAVRFDVNSFALRSETIGLLDELGKALRHPGLADRALLVNGHTDFDGSENFNLHLSLKRAGSVKQYLVNNHLIPPTRLKVMGYGEGLPLVANTSAANKQLNRRVEIVATK